MCFSPKDYDFFSSSRKGDIRKFPMTRGTMPINKDEYNNKKEYYDYQRKVEYNREQIEKATERFNGRVFNQHTSTLT